MISPMLAIVMTLNVHVWYPPGMQSKKGAVSSTSFLYLPLLTG
jgi:hypothetical protein